MNTDNAVITPSNLHIDESELTDLKARLGATRWPDAGPTDDWSDGLPLSYARELAAYWKDEFDWRAQEARINAVSQFTTVIGDHPIHFFHERSPRPDAKPLLLVHGWPSGPTDFLDMLPLLTDPGEGQQAFDVVVPTIPGFGISGPTNGWTLAGVADAFAVLMERLGYDRYLAHGYDTGAGVVRELGLRHGDAVAAVHTTGMLGGEELTPETADMSVPEEARAIEAGMRYQYEIGAYAMLQSTRPQSLAYALTDSPVGQMSWMVERFHDWTGAQGSPDDVLGRDQMSIYWFFRTAGSSARYYKYGLPNWAEPLQPSTIPTAVLVMPNDIGGLVRRLAEKADNIVHWRKAPTGGHFAAWEQSALVAEDIRESIGHFD
ncbi:epoxide hydrolase family protein [Mobilicoccus massiliensis]|uniref:epoxide hydrolase family protein n=1 Tax=Mobilicoccus massiliensis TaxID=1522310 RepID=UPI00058E5A05|nr:epoxide hydrolase family protein [Mobilicoccus massiliensis]